MLFIYSGTFIYTALFHVVPRVVCRLLGRLSPVCLLSIACCFFIVLSRYHWALTGAFPIIGYKLRPAPSREVSGLLGRRKAVLDGVCFE